MFNFVKNLFKKESVDYKQVAEEYEKEYIKLYKENEKMKNQLSWFESLGLPTQETLSSGFDYYDFLKNKINELEADKQALVTRNASMHKKIKQLQELEKMFLQEISELKSKLEAVKLASIDANIIPESSENNKIDFKPQVNYTQPLEPEKAEVAKPRTLKEVKEYLNKINLRA